MDQPSAAFVRRAASRRGALLSALALLVALVAPGLGALTAPAEAVYSGAPAPVTADPLPTVQTDGVVYSMEVVGNTVYAVGNFNRARPAGVAPGGPGEVRRDGILAFDIRTGALLPFNPSITGTPFTSTGDHSAFCDRLGPDRWVCENVFRVKASPDGRMIYIGGDFTAIDGVSRFRLAAFDTATGAMDPNFRPVVNQRVRALAVSSTTVYAGGSFATVNSQPRERLAAISRDGTLLPWAPRADGKVRAMTMAPDGSRVIVGGNFDRLNDTAIRGLGALSATTGANTRWDSRAIPRESSTRLAYVTDLVTSGQHVYVAVTGDGHGVFDGRLSVNPYTGAVRWYSDCLGATKGVAVARNVVYSASHAHDCSVMGAFPEVTPIRHQRILAETADPAGTDTRGRPAPDMLHFFPNTDSGPPNSFFKQGAWAAAANDTYVVLGGDFTTVNGQPQQGLVRFGLPSVAPNAVGPEQPLAAPTGTSVQPGSVRLLWTATWDRDDPSLRYEIYRDGSSTPLHTQSARSSFWSLPTLGFTDTSATPGGSHRYRVRAVDSRGNTVQSTNSAAISVASGDRVPGYAGTVLDDGAGPYWRLGESGGTTARDLAGGPAATVGSGVTWGVPGAITDDPNTAARFSGTAAGTAGGPGPAAAPQEFTIEGWFRTTSTRSGKILGFGNSQLGRSTSYDRQIYLTDTGRIAFGVFAGGPRVVTSTQAYNDGAWHHVAATMDAGGLSLFVDGTRVARDTRPVRAAEYAGHWRIGGDNLGAWPGASGTDTFQGGAFAGAIDEVAVYRVPLSASQIAAHAAAGGSQPAQRTAIEEKWWALGGPDSALGMPTTGERTTPDGIGRYVHYQNGSIYWTPRTGANEVRGAIHATWRLLGWELSALRYPTTDELPTPDGRGRYNDFEVGSIYWTPTTGAREVRGLIRSNWLALGGVRSAVGYPTSNELPTPDGRGRYNNFQIGSIYWTPTTGAREVRGAIRDTWNSLGGVRAAVGYPTSNELPTPDGRGRFNHFQIGSIYWTPTTGAREVRGAIRDRWNSLGAERSSLGYPVSNEFSVPGGRASDFQGGRITWSSSTGATTVTPR